MRILQLGCCIQMNFCISSKNKLERNTSEVLKQEDCVYVIQFRESVLRRQPARLLGFAGSGPLWRCLLKGAILTEAVAQIKFFSIDTFVLCLKSLYGDRGKFGHILNWKTVEDILCYGLSKKKKERENAVGQIVIVRNIG